MTCAVEPLLTEQQIQDYRRDGFIVVRQLFSKREVDEIRDAFMDLAADGPIPGLFEVRETYSKDDPLSRYPRVMHPHRHPDRPVGPIAMRYMLDSRIESVMTALFEEEPIAAQSMFYFKPPGARGQDLHQDNFYLRVSPGTCAAAWVAIDDADQENGGMVTVPLSGSLDVACPEKADPTIFFTSDHVSPPPGLKDEPVNLKAGDVLFFNGSVIHGSYPNTSADRFRRALIFHYVPRTSAEVSHWYRPLLTFSGEEVPIPGATGGGPCGDAVGTVQPSSPH